ncbi:sel1 repeat family protein [Inhella crocodyli]|uniref:Sel1 repeat family protein n=1 Tax=Inhella crocodyli TaxID=2499851 RepID=A0A3S3TCZ4_9BURK|nr:sel1 repeat family protein [Inhella crocodyli]RVT88344.1 sel1 repeat family protein [Inhella crocodyli]
MDESKGGQAQTVEFVDLPEGRTESLSRLRSWLRRRWRGVALTLAAVGLMVGGWLVNERVVQPWRDEQAIQLAIEALEEDRRNLINAWSKHWSSEERLIKISRELKADSKSGTLVMKEGFAAALRLAIRQGSAAAHLELGRAHRSGAMVQKDPSVALAHFQRAAELLRAALLIGDPDAQWLHAQMMAEGLGMLSDEEAAEKLALLSAKSISSWHVSKLSEAMRKGDRPFTSKQSAQLAAQALERSWTAGVKDIYFEGLLACIGNQGDELTVSAGDGIEQKCVEGWLGRAAKVDVPRAAGYYGLLLVVRGTDANRGLSWLNKGVGLLNWQQRLVRALTVATLAETQDKAEIDGLRAVFLEGFKRDKDFARNLWSDVPPAEAFTKEQWVRLGVAISQAAFPDAIDKIGHGLAEEFNSTQGTHFGFLIVGFAQAAELRSQEASRQQVKPQAKANSAPAPANQGSRADGADLLADLMGRPTADAVDGSQVADPDQQEKTGYVTGSKRLATGGRSSFTIDNSRGGGDALVRLYREGGGSAVRSVFVKNGEKFKLQGLAAGRYVMRYRYMGSTKTYEADQVFDLQEVDEADGVRFSNVRVTLYQVQGGNMRTKEVPSEQF